MANQTSVTDVVFEEYVITTTVTSSGAAVECWLRETQQLLRDLAVPVVGIGAEWTRSDHPKFQNPVALLQLCVGRRCLIFQAKQFSDATGHAPESLKLFLADPSFRFVGFGIEEYLERLIKDYTLDVPKAIDLRGMAAAVMSKPELRQAGLQDLAHTMGMGVNLHMSSIVRTKGSWHAYRLSNEQIKYACIDAFLCSEVGCKLFACKSSIDRI